MKFFAKSIFPFICLFIAIASLTVNAITYKDQRFVKNTEIQNVIKQDCKEFCLSIDEFSFNIDVEHILYSLYIKKNENSEFLQSSVVDRISTIVPVVDKLNGKFKGNIYLIILPHNNPLFNDIFNMLCNQNTFDENDFDCHIHCFSRQNRDTMPCCFYEQNGLDNDSPKNIITTKTCEKDPLNINFYYLKFFELVPGEKSLVRVIYE